MKRIFHATASALTYTVLIRHTQAHPTAQSHEFNKAVRFILNQHERMPDYFRFPLMMLTVVFDFAAIAVHGKPFHLLAHAQRLHFLTIWQSIPLTPCADLLQFYQNLAIFFHYGQQHS